MIIVNVARRAAIAPSAGRASAFRISDSERPPKEVQVRIRRGEHLAHCVATDVPLAVHRAEVELVRINNEVILL